MELSDLVKIKSYYSSLVGIKEIVDGFDDYTRNYIYEMPVKEYEDFVLEVNETFPKLLVPFQKDKYFSHSNDNVQEKYYDLAGISINITRNLSILKSILDNSDSNTTSITDKEDFIFIKNDKIRKVLIRDYQDIQKCLIINSFKSVIILCGGSIEAILLDLLSNNTSKALASKKAPNNEKDINKWNLNDLILVAVEEKFVESDIGNFTHSVRKYRNLIHPGNEISEKIKVEPEEAKIAYQILNILIRELS